MAILPAHLCEAGDQDAVASGHGAGQASGEGERHGQAVAQADDDVPDAF
nr:hypothetical protein [Deinococcus sp. KSM4-11]